VISIRTNAQTTVTGNVVDEISKQPIEFATVQLLHLPDSAVIKGTATDKKGRFSIAGVMPGNYVLHYSFIGFGRVETSAFVIETGKARYDVGQISLSNQSGRLKEVTVTAKRSALNTSIDRKTYSVDQDIMSKSGSVSDILKNIPSVEVDIDGNVALRGSGDVIILINGKPSPLMGRSRAEVLQQLPANSIDRIEVITNPSARYRPDGTSGIINIVLKKNIRNGFNGSAIANAGNRDRYNGNLTVNYKPKKWNLFGSYSIRQDSRRRVNTIDRTYLDSITGISTGFYNQVTRSLTRPLSNILTAGMDYNFDEHNSIGVSGSYYHRRQLRSDVSNNFTYDGSGLLVNSYDRYRHDPELEKQGNATIYYQHGFAKEDHEVRIEFNTSRSREKEDNHYTNYFYTPKAYTGYDNTLIQPRDHENQLTIDYSNPLTEDSKLEVGYDGLYNTSDQDFFGESYDTTLHKFVKDEVVSNRFVYRENIHALYVTYQKSFSKFGYSVGLRMEQSFTKGHLVTLDSFVKNDLTKVYPTIHLSYKLKGNSELQLNYSKRVHRPESDDLNPFPEYQDPKNLRAGNPALLPEIIHSVEFGYKWQNKTFSFVPSIYYRYKANGFTRVIVIRPDSSALTTIQNLSSDQSAGLELIFSAKTKWMTTNVSTNIFYNRINAVDLGFINNRSIFSMTTNINSTFPLTKTLMLQVSANYRSARLAPQGKTYPSFVFNAGMRQDLFKNKLSITLTGSDLFNSLREKSLLETTAFQQISIGRRDGRIIYLGLSYRFGVIKKVKEEKMQWESE
jgi:outer membrane receptor protein involved in Fe transport